MHTCFNENLAQHIGSQRGHFTWFADTGVAVGNAWSNLERQEVEWEVPWGDHPSHAHRHPLDVVVRSSISQLLSTGYMV